MTRICVFAVLRFATISKVAEDEYFIISQTGGYTTEPTLTIICLDTNRLKCRVIAFSRARAGPFLCCGSTEPAPRLPSPHRRQDEIQNKAKFNEASE